MTDFGSIPVPAKPPARIQKAMPAPFQRPRISLGGADVKRHWRNVLACTLAPGDTIPGIGVLYQVDDVRPPGGGWEFHVEGGLHNRRVYQASDLVFAYVPEPAR